MVRKRKKVRFNLIDAVIVIFILAVIAMVVYFLIGKFRLFEHPSDENFKFEIRIENVKKESLESLENLSLLEKGTVVRDSATGEEIGKIESYEAKKSIYYGGLIQSESGYVLGSTESEDEYDLYITVSCHADQDSRGIYMVDDIRMVIGEAVNFKIKSFSSIAYIVKTEIPNETETQ